jgi:hypothetical protein
MDPSAINGAGLVDLIDALERVKAACAAVQATATATFVEEQAEEAQRWREAAAEASGFDDYRVAKDNMRRCEFEPVALNERVHRSSGRSRGRGAYDKAGVAAQIGMARHESPARGARLATTALALTRDLPHTLTALAAGILNERRAELVAKLTSHLSPEQRAEVDAEVVGANLPQPDDENAPGIAVWGDRRLEAAVRAAADRIDAEAAVKRARTAESERRVSIRPIPDTMALVTAVLPVAQAVAIHAALTRAAASAKAAGDERTRGQVMADTLVSRVVPPATSTQDGGGPAATANPADPSIEGLVGGSVASAVDAPVGASVGASVGAAVDASLEAMPEIPIEVQLVITDRALLAGDDTPAHIPGYGPVPAGWARELLTQDLRQRLDRAGGRKARIWLRRMYTYPDTGTLVAMESQRRLFPAGLRRYLIARDGTCRTPWCDAPIRHADHVIPAHAGGATNSGNGQGLCERCNQVKEQPGWGTQVTHAGPTADDGRAHTVRIVTPTGHAHTSVAPPVLAGLVESFDRHARDRLRREAQAAAGFPSTRLVA